jgi:hypothetical protein
MPLEINQEEIMQEQPIATSRSQRGQSLWVIEKSRRGTHPEMGTSIKNHRLTRIQRI